MTAYAIEHRGRRRRARHEFLRMHGRRRRGGRHGFGPPGFDRMFFGPGRKAGRGDIRATILALLADPERAERIGAEAAAIVAADHSWMSVCDRLQPLLGIRDARARRSDAARP